MIVLKKIRLLIMLLVCSKCVLTSFVKQTGNNLMKDLFDSAFTQLKDTVAGKLGVDDNNRMGPVAGPVVAFGYGKGKFEECTPDRHRELADQAETCVENAKLKVSKTKDQATLCKGVERAVACFDVVEECYRDQKAFQQDKNRLANYEHESLKRQGYNCMFSNFFTKLNPFSKSASGAVVMMNSLLLTALAMLGVVGV